VFSVPNIPSLDCADVMDAKLPI